MGWGGRCGCCPGRLDLLCVLALLAGCLLPVCRTRVYTNHWAVKIAGGFPEANRIASKYGFINVGQVTAPAGPALGPGPWSGPGEGGIPLQQHASHPLLSAPLPPLPDVLLQLF